MLDDIRLETWSSRCFFGIIPSNKGKIMEVGTFQVIFSHISVKIGQNSKMFLLINEVKFLVQLFMSWGMGVLLLLIWYSPGRVSNKESDSQIQVNVLYWYLLSYFFLVTWLYPLGFLWLILNTMVYGLFGIAYWNRGCLGLLAETVTYKGVVLDFVLKC